ncbi:MAG TPA: protein kinase [Ideonella sp.]|uniref:protein kinase domain-containing protein n=1 Tax=Ideonella sp. TaxID=1929293 RepID=UPI002E30D1A3|nr:protein kinase [Ideonella sp.]HEX5687878.1 protein kinase [Ideonella sp.]
MTTLAAPFDAVPAPQRWARVSALLDEALDLAADARDAWLAALMQREPTLAPELTRLLQAHATCGDHDPLAHLPSLGRHHGDATSGFDAGRALQAGQCIGPWRLAEPLGAGGMAVVWRAERADGAYARQVALKLPQRLPWRGDLAARLGRERDILARLEHPHVARLYDAGVDQGLPWLAMELVDQAQPLTDWCDARALGLRARVKLFLQVLDAVAHAHAALVLHRDLKPSNILVDRRGQVKLLDFGIAKLLDEELGRTTDTQLTQFCGRLLTPDYASPEQLRGEPLTTASDVYALGVLLYELLCGERPHRLKQASPAQRETAVLQTPPTRPSAKPLAAAARARGLTPRRLAHALRGELDAIVLAALRKSPLERTASVAALREDLQRWLDGLPVRARPDSRWVRLRSFVRRHHTAVAMGALLAGTLIVTTAVSVRQGLLAEREARRAAATRDFLLALYKPVSWLDANPARGAKVSARELLDLSAQRLRDHPVADPEVQHDVLATLADLYGDVDDDARQREVTTELAGFTARAFGARSPEHFDALVRQSLAAASSDQAEARRLLDRAATLLAQVPRTALGALARYWLARGNLSEDHDPAEAEQAFGQAIALLQGQPAQAPYFSRALIGLARVRWMSQNRLADARGLYERALAVLRADPATPAFALTKPQAELADVLSRLGELPAARALYQEAHARSRDGLGPAHVDSLQTGLRLARAQRDAGRPQQALALLSPLRDTLVATSGRDEAYTLPSIERELAEAHAVLGQWDEAQRDFEQALAGLARRARQAVATGTDTSAIWWAGLAALRAEAGDSAAAQAALQRARTVPAAVAHVPRVQLALARAEAIAAVMTLATQPQARSEADTKLAAWQVQAQQQVADAHRVLRARVEAELALWRARAALWAGQPALAARTAQAGLAAVDDEVLARVGPIEQGQLRAVWAEALLATTGDRDQACRVAAGAALDLVAAVPTAPETWLASRIDARCRGVALPTGAVHRRLQAVPAWQQRDLAAARAFAR